MRDLRVEPEERLDRMAPLLPLEHCEVAILQPNLAYRVTRQRRAPRVGNPRRAGKRAQVPMQRQKVAPIAVGMEERLHRDGIALV